MHELKLHRQEKFLYICDTLHMWEWDVAYYILDQTRKAVETENIEVRVTELERASGAQKSRGRM